MPDLQEILKSRQAQDLTRDAARLEQLRDMPEMERVFQLLGQSAGGDLEQAASRAVQGDATALLGAIQLLMRNPEGKKLVEQIQSKAFGAKDAK